jgi:hypothetical protein
MSHGCVKPHVLPYVMLLLLLYAYFFNIFCFNIQLFTFKMFEIGVLHLVFYIYTYNFRSEVPMGPSWTLVGLKKRPDGQIQGIA